MRTPDMATAARRTLTHPVTPAVVLLTVAVALLGLSLTGEVPVLLPWVVLALSAGYAISGSV
jgi:hypothetical protein